MQASGSSSLIGRASSSRGSTAEASFSLNSLQATALGALAAVPLIRCKLRVRILLCLSVPIWVQKHKATAAAAAAAGGASFSLHSLQAAALGALAAIPLVTYKLNFWSPDTKQQNPTVSALHKALIDNAKPWIQGMTSGQMAVHVVLDTLPVLFLMLPAAQAGLTASFAWSSAAIGRSVGLDLPQEVGFGIALLMTAVVTAGVRSTELMADPQQVDIVSEAVANADRWVDIACFCQPYCSEMLYLYE